jgi:hypothetical protein
MSNFCERSIIVYEPLCRKIGIVNKMPIGTQGNWAIR